MPIAPWAICRRRMRNYLVRLGWSHGDQEIFSTEEMIAAFDLPQIGRSPARFDFAKLENLNGHYIRQTADADARGRDRAACCRTSPAGRSSKAKLDARRCAQAAARHAGPEGARQDADRADRRRALHLRRPAARARDKAAALLTAGGARPDRRASPAAGSRRGLGRRDHRSRRCAPSPSATALKLGAIAQPLRAALTGRTTSPAIFDVLAVLGRDESLARLRRPDADGSMPADPRLRHVRRAMRIGLHLAVHS